jgi:ribosomal protein S30
MEMEHRREAKRDGGRSRTPFHAPAKSKKKTVPRQRKKKDSVSQLPCAVIAASRPSVARLTKRACSSFFFLTVSPKVRAIKEKKDRAVRVQKERKKERKKKGVNNSKFGGCCGGLSQGPLAAPSSLFLRDPIHPIHPHRRRR